ncbi:hypothetical protein [Variovorax sp. OV084]|uniref:hypothetical protein n=1 Tax=Variovorax sp. OV084 TaxID=1882777 RepID=UPI000B87FFE4|nr:hypothetical protein [Variovorax sp. OV084]
MKANRLSAGYFFSAQWLAMKAEWDKVAEKRKTSMAWSKRQFNRLRGPYRDPIKALIRQRVGMYFERRIRNSKRAQQTDEPNGILVPAFDLEAIRTRHRAELAQRDVDSCTR